MKITRVRQIRLTDGEYVMFTPPHGGGEVVRVKGLGYCVLGPLERVYPFDACEWLDVTGWETND